SRVVRMRTAVVLPAPLGPSRPSTVPAGTVRSMPSRAWTAPKHLVRFSTRIAGRSATGHSFAARGLSEIVAYSPAHGAGGTARPHAGRQAQVRRFPLSALRP